MVSSTVAKRFGIFPSAQKQFGGRWDSVIMTEAQSGTARLLELFKKEFWEGRVIYSVRAFVVSRRRLASSFITPIATFGSV